MSEEFTEEQYRRPYIVKLEMGWLWVYNEITNSGLRLDTFNRVEAELACNQMNQVYSDIYDWVNSNVIGKNV